MTRTVRSADVTIKDLLDPETAIEFTEAERANLELLLGRDIPPDPPNPGGGK